MSRAKPDAFIAGFSLIEALAAVALSATIIMLLSLVTGQWLPNWKRGFVDLQRADLLAIGLARVVQDISAAEYVTPSADAAAPLFEGDETSVTFVRSAIGPDFILISKLCVSPRARTIAALRRPEARRPSRPERRAALGRLSLSRPRRAYSVAFYVSFAYAGPEPCWVANWRGQKRLPDAVRVTVRDAASRQPGGRGLDGDLDESHRAGVPKLEAQASAGGASPSTATPTQGAAGPEPRHQRRRADVALQSRRRLEFRFRPRRRPLDSGRLATLASIYRHIRSTPPPGCACSTTACKRRAPFARRWR